MLGGKTLACDVCRARGRVQICAHVHWYGYMPSLGNYSGPVVYQQIIYFSLFHVYSGLFRTIPDYYKLFRTIKPSSINFGQFPVVSKQEDISSFRSC